MNRQVLDDPIRIEVGRWAISELACGGEGMRPWYHTREIAGVNTHLPHCKPDCPEKHENVHLQHHAWVPHSGIKFTCASELDARIFLAEIEVEKIKKRYESERDAARDLRKRLRAALDLISTFKETVKDVKEFRDETTTPPATGA